MNLFRSYHLPVLSDEQNDNQSEEIKVTDESRAENSPVPVQEAEKRLKKIFGRPFCLLCFYPLLEERERVQFIE